MASASRGIDVLLIVCFFLFAVIALTIGRSKMRTEQRIAGRCVLLGVSTLQT